MEVEGKGGQIGQQGDAQPINFLVQPISHVLSLCPFLLMTHFLSAVGPFPERERGESGGGREGRKEKR